MKAKVQPSPKGLHVLFIAAEADPFIKVGGLGDVAGSLPLALRQANPELDIRLAIPFYGSINIPSPHRLIAEYPIKSTSGQIQAKVFQTEHFGLPVYLISGAPIQPGSPVYGSDFAQDAEKFIFFSLACLVLPIALNWKVDILHANDWHTAIAVYDLSRRARSIPQLQTTKSLLSVHNLPFMGTDAAPALEKFLIPPAKTPTLPVWSRTTPLPLGLDSADKIVAVSPTYAREILTPLFGCGLDEFLKTRSLDITGILNGIDIQCWNPEKDSLIEKNFSCSSITNRVNNKESLQIELDLHKSPASPLLAFIGRMDRQKGVDLLIDIIQEISDLDWQMIVLGTGDPQLELELQLIQRRFPSKLRVINKFDSSFSHRIYAGADILLMPSRYEPCGLAQMIAMHYGCIPVANATGGLNDTIIDYSNDSKNATGFLSNDINVCSFVQSIQLAMAVFQNHDEWHRLQSNAMQRDFSWQASAMKYLSLYYELTE